MPRVDGCALCGHDAHVEVCGRPGSDDICDCAHSIVKMLHRTERKVPSCL